MADHNKEEYLNPTQQAHLTANSQQIKSDPRQISISTNPHHQTVIRSADPSLPSSASLPSTSQSPFPNALPSYSNDRSNEEITYVLFKAVTLTVFSVKINNFMKRVIGSDVTEVALSILLGISIILLLIVVSFFVLPVALESIKSTWETLRQIPFQFVIISICIIGLGLLAGLIWGRCKKGKEAHNQTNQFSKGRNNLQSENEQPREQLKQKNDAIQTLAKSQSPVTPSPGTIALSGDSIPEAPFLSPVQPLIQTPPAIQKIDPVYTKPERDPDDFNDKDEHPHLKHFPASKEERNSLHDGWKIIGASRRGFGHAYEGRYREDDFKVTLVGQDNGTSGLNKITAYFGRNKRSDQEQEKDIALVAIADGVSSKALSRHGARAAVLGATTSELEPKLLHLAQLVKNYGEDPRCQEEARHILIECCERALYSVKQQAIKDEVAENELQSTLMVFLAIPHQEHCLFVASVQIGDGALFALVQDEHSQSHRWQLLQNPQIQATGNEVQPFIYSTPAMWNNYFHCDSSLNATFIMGMTDGTADDIEPPRPTHENPNPDPFIYVHDFYQHIKNQALSRPEPLDASVALEGFLGYRKRQSFDDRTVVCLYRQQ